MSRRPHFDYDGYPYNRQGLVDEYDCLDHSDYYYEDDDYRGQPFDIRNHSTYVPGEGRIYAPPERWAPIDDYDPYIYEPWYNRHPSRFEPARQRRRGTGLRLDMDSVRDMTYGESYMNFDSRYGSGGPDQYETLRDRYPSGHLLDGWLCHPGFD